MAGPGRQAGPPQLWSRPDGGITMSSDGDGAVISLLSRIDERITELRDLVVQQRMIQDKYSTAEAAKGLGKSEFTVREWCRLGRVRAEKRPCGRGHSQEWSIS